MVKPLWKLLSLMMSLASFAVVAAYSVVAGDELPWIVLRSVITFIVCWIILGNLGNILNYVLPDHDEDFESEVDDNKSEKG